MEAAAAGPVPCQLASVVQATLANITVPVDADLALSYSTSLAKRPAVCERSPSTRSKLHADLTRWAIFPTTAHTSSGIVFPELSSRAVRVAAVIGALLVYRREQ